MFKIKFPTKRIFRIFTILRINGMAPFCNLFMEQPCTFCLYYYCQTSYTVSSRWSKREYPRKPRWNIVKEDINSYDLLLMSIIIILLLVYWTFFVLLFCNNQATGYACQHFNINLHPSTGLCCILAGVPHHLFA